MTSSSWLKRILNGTNLPISYRKTQKGKSKLWQTLGTSFRHTIENNTVGPESRKNIMHLLDWCCSNFAKDPWDLSDLSDLKSIYFLMRHHDWKLKNKSQSNFEKDLRDL